MLGITGWFLNDCIYISIYVYIYSFYLSIYVSRSSCCDLVVLFSQHQQQVMGAIERAKQVTPPEMNSIIRVSFYLFIVLSLLFHTDPSLTKIIRKKKG